MASHAISVDIVCRFHAIIAITVRSIVSLLHIDIIIIIVICRLEELLLVSFLYIELYLILRVISELLSLVSVNLEVDRCEVIVKVGTVTLAPSHKSEGSVSFRRYAL